MRLARSRNIFRRLFLLAVFASALVSQIVMSASAGPGVDDIDDPMKFVVVRSSTPFCEPNCPEFIWARGAIEAGTPAAFKKLLKRIGNKRLPIVLSSPGGSVDAAYKLGRMIRERKLDVGVGSAYLTACPAAQPDCEAQQKKTGVYSGVVVDYGVYCNSACPLVLAGGVRRLAGPTTYVGVHQITTTYSRETIRYREKYKIVKGKKRVIEKKIVSRKKVGSYQTTKLSKSSERAFLAYLKEMGVAKSYFAAAQGTPAKDMRQLSRLEMIGMSLVTREESAGIFARAGLCQSGRPAENCVGEVALAARRVKPYPKAIIPPNSQMWFAVVRSSESGCEPDCPEWISAEGDIDPKALSRFETILKALEGRKLPLVVSSNGGDAETAIALGNMIRENRLDVAVGSTVFSGCKPRSKNCVATAKTGAPYFGNAVSGGGECTRDCMLMLAGGKTRLAGYGTFVGWEIGDKPSETVLATYSGQVNVKTESFDSGPPVKLDDYAQFRLMKRGLLTRTSAVDLLVDGAICRTIPTPGNCRAASPGEFPR